ncbi:hypothetical protein ACEQ8H_004523 [Pleosporales sp. CAS-2024a]
MAPDGVLSWDKFQEQKDRVKPVPKYDAATESKTPHPWWDLDRDSIQVALTNIASKVASSTNGTTNLDRELHHVLNTATELERVKRTTTVKVALIGAQGAGKSLLINALFDCPGLSLTGAKGWACTSAVVRYAYGSGPSFTAEVQFLDAKMREAMVDEHIRSYVHYHNDLEDSDDEDGAPRIRSVTQDDYDRKRKQTAEDFFVTIFDSRDEFLSAWSSNPVNTGEFKSLCQLKCKEAMELYDVNSKGVTLFSKSNPNELLENVKPFLADVSNETCLWPLVDCITIRFCHNLLKEGIEIIDLPGSGDVNMLRARHADGIKDSVDVEIILADTIRIATDDFVISNARAGLLNHGADKVKIVATKIDAITEDEVSQALGIRYEELNLLIDQADRDIASAEEAGEDAKCTQVSRYKEYLHRRKKSWVIAERARGISIKLGDAIKGPSSTDCIEIIHTSTSSYMLWIKNDKIAFKDQPALVPEETGVPKLRRFLFNLPATQNLRDMMHHINVAVPAYVDKLQRVVTQSDRDAGFTTIANDFDALRVRIVGDLEKQLKWHCLDFSCHSLAKVKKDVKAYKVVMETMIQKRWLTLRSPAFTRLLKCRGTVLKGVSKAKGLENTVNWNAELASILQPGFQNWYATHSKNMQDLRQALPPAIDRLYRETLDMMSRSAANLITVEKAKMKWSPLNLTMHSKLLGMADEMIAEEKRLLHRITLEDERENNIIAAITDKIFDDVLLSVPAEKPSNGKYKRYVTPIFKFRKERLVKHFINDEAHFVDRVIKEFKDELDGRIQGLIDKHLARLTASLDDFSNLLRDHAPVDYAINSTGQVIRTELEKCIPYVEDQATTLRSMLPADEEGGASTVLTELLDDNEDSPQDLTGILKRMNKRKRFAPKTDAPIKKIKQESL